MSKDKKFYVEVKDNESLDNALSKFKKLLNRDGILIECKKRMFYEKPSEKRHKKYLKRLRKIRKKRFWENPKRKGNLKWIVLRRKKRKMKQQMQQEMY